MSLQDDLRENPEVASALAAAIDVALGRETQLTIGGAHATIADVITDDEARAVALEFDLLDDIICVIAFIATSAFTATLEGAAPDELFLTATAPAIAAAAAAALATLTQVTIDVVADDAREVPITTLAAELADDAVVYPLLDGTEPVGCVAFHTRLAVADTSTNPAGPMFQSPLASSAAPVVLANVEMGVTAELGRARTTLRDLLSLTPGAVIDLDRAAGSPVDLLVNGTVIARGEVVVIDEEFGVRITELLSGARGGT